MRILILAIAATLALAGCQRAAADQGAASAAFLAENAKAAGVRVLPSGVQYKVVREGPPGGRRPGPNDEVKVHYEGKLIDGKVFDSSYERGQPAAMPLPALIPAWVEALQLMRPGDEWVLYVPPELGYGAQGGGEIPPNSALIFRIELIDFIPAPGSVGAG